MKKIISVLFCALLGMSIATAEPLTEGVGLPVKVLAWEGRSGQVWLSYNDPAYIAGRHGIVARDEIVQKMSEALDKISAMAVAP